MKFNGKQIQKKIEPAYLQDERFLKFWKRKWKISLEFAPIVQEGHQTNDDLRCFDFIIEPSTRCVLVCVC